jgi:hypothetical protein
MASPSSTFFARDSLRFNAGSYQTLHRRRGSRFIVRAGTVSFYYMFSMQQYCRFWFFLTRVHREHPIY